MVQQKISIQNLPAMVDIYHNLILWLINYSRETLEGKPPDKIMRMNILQKTFNVLGEDEEALLSDMIADTPDNPWVRGTEKYGYIDEYGNYKMATPGISVNGLRVNCTFLKPHPSSFPYMQFVSLLSNICKELKIDHTNLLFNYNNHIFESPEHLVMSIRNHEYCPYELTQRLRSWHHTLSNDLQTIIENVNRSDSTDMPEPLKILSCADQEFMDLVMSDEIFSLDKNDSRIQYYVVREVLLAILEISLRSLQRWDSCGLAAGDYEWPAPFKAGGNLVYYYFPDYLHVIQLLVRKERDRRRDRQMLLELETYNCAV